MRGTKWFEQRRRAKLRLLSFIFYYFTRFLYPFCCWKDYFVVSTLSCRVYSLSLLQRQPHKMVKHSQTIPPLFVGLALKGLYCTILKMRFLLEKWTKISWNLPETPCKCLPIFCSICCRRKNSGNSTKWFKLNSWLQK